MLDNLRLNIQKLIASYEEQKQRADELDRRLELCEAEILKYKEQITDLNSKIDELSLMGAFNSSSSGDKETAINAISKLIHEIDKCIKMIDN